MLQTNRSFRPEPYTIPPEGEVEVAQIVYLDGMRGDVSPASSPGVATVFASRRDGKIVYRIDVDGGSESMERRPCNLPLTLGQLIHFIDQSGNGITFWNHLRGQGYKPHEMPRFNVSSSHYPSRRSRSKRFTFPRGKIHRRFRAFPLRFWKPFWISLRLLRAGHANA